MEEKLKLYKWIAIWAFLFLFIATGYYIWFIYNYPVETVIVKEPKVVIKKVVQTKTITIRTRPKAQKSYEQYVIVRYSQYPYNQKNDTIQIFPYDNNFYLIKLDRDGELRGVMPYNLDYNKTIALNVRSYQELRYIDGVKQTSLER